MIRADLHVSRAVYDDDYVTSIRAMRSDGEGAGPAVRRLSKVLSGLVTPELVETIQHAVKDVTQHVAGAAKKAGATKETAEQVEAAFKTELGGVREKLVPHIVDIAKALGKKRKKPQCAFTDTQSQKCLPPGEPTDP